MSGAVEEIPELPRPQPNGLRALLTHPSFSRLWKAMLVSSLGDWVGFVAPPSLSECGNVVNIDVEPLLLCPHCRSP
jgi:hypothetical protein